MKDSRSVAAFLNQLQDGQIKEDAFTALNLLQEVTGMEAKMWEHSIIGFGSYHYKYESGREGDFIKIGFSPRKKSTAFYVISEFPEYEELKSKLGQHKTGKSCLYISKLSNIDLEILKAIMTKSFEEMNKKYPMNE